MRQRQTGAAAVAVRNAKQRSRTIKGGAGARLPRSHKGSLHRPTSAVRFCARSVAALTPPLLLQVRVTRGKLASGSVVEPPAVLRERKWARPAADGPKDTSDAARTKQTYKPVPHAAAAAAAT